MRALRFSAALLALAALPACSLLGLDKLPQARCTEDSQCASLESIQPTGDTCRTWQCNNPDGGDGVCVIATRDDDGDGSPPMMCAVGVTPDCDDMDETRAPTNLDACDLVDNDCDGVIDPSFAAMTTRVVSGTTAPARVVFSAYEELPVLVGAVPARGTSAALSTGTLSFADLSLTLAATNTSNAEAGVGAVGRMPDQTVMAVYDPVAAGGECGAAGQIEARWLSQAGMGATVLATGCLDQSRLASSSVTSEPEGDALLVWVEDDAASRECGMTVADAAVNARVLRGFRAGARVDASPVMALGTTTDALGPSVTFVPGQGWIVAHTSSGGDVIVSRIPVTTTLTAYEASMISTIDATMAAEVTVTTGEGSTVAVAYTEGGCNATNRVVVRTADVSAGSVTFGAEFVATADSTRNRRAPYASRGARRDEWVVIYREVSDEIAVRLDAAGAIVGMPVPLGVGTVAGRPYARTEGEDTGNPGWYFAAATTTGEIYAGTFDCAGTP